MCRGTVPAACPEGENWLWCNNCLYCFRSAHIQPLIHHSPNTPSAWLPPSVGSSKSTLTQPFHSLLITSTSALLLEMLIAVVYGGVGVASVFVLVLVLLMAKLWLFYVV